MRVGGRKRCIGRYYAELFLIRNYFLPVYIPAFIKLSFIEISPVIRNLVWCMHSCRRIIQEKWFIRICFFCFRDIADGLISKLFAKVAPISRLGGIIFYQCRFILVGLRP